jgi:ketopantoate hydroxymethyltransferase
VSTDFRHGQAEETDLIAQLARSYEVAGDLYLVAEAVIEHVAETPTQEERTATIPMPAALLKTPDLVARLRR